MLNHWAVRVLQGYFVASAETEKGVFIRNAEFDCCAFFVFTSIVNTQIMDRNDVKWRRMEQNDNFIAEWNGLIYQKFSLWGRRELIDLFSLYVLFPHFRTRDTTLGNSPMHVQMYAQLWRNKRKIPIRALRGLKWENKTYKLKKSIYLTPSSLIFTYV